MADKICKNCGEMITNPKQRLYCNIDCRLEFHSGSKGRAKASAQREKWSSVPDEERMMDCICPLCGKLYQLKLYWTGANITPRIRCKKCKQTIKNTAYSEVRVFEMS